MIGWSKANGTPLGAAVGPEIAPKPELPRNTALPQRTAQSFISPFTTFLPRASPLAQLRHMSASTRTPSTRLFSTTPSKNDASFTIQEQSGTEEWRRKEVDVAALRKEYSEQMLDEKAMPENPMDLFKKWFQDACETDMHEPNAMCLATVGQDGQPSARFVLMKDFDDRGIVWYTNYESKKSSQLTENPRAAITFWWGTLERQVRFEGPVTKVSPEESDKYFQSRPRGSQIGAWVSDQSRTIEGREGITQKEK